jgi:NTP pyrophosphatase (non-canonical NTP hydrolase)
MADSNGSGCTFSEQQLSVYKSINQTHKTAPTALNSGKPQSHEANHMQIREFQEMMKQLYFKRDSERGIEGTFNWLVDEVAELGEELKGKDRAATEKEFADVIAWLASLANIMGIDLEKAALDKYPHRCPKCGQNPCACTF